MRQIFPEEVPWLLPRLAKLETSVASLSGTSAGGTGDMTKAVYDADDDGKVDEAAAADSVPWTGVSDKPSTFAPATHSHAISDTTGLQTALDGKAASSHTHTASAITDFDTAADARAAAAVATHEGLSDPHPGYLTPAEGNAAYAALSHAHTASNITDFNEAVDDRVAALLVNGSNITLTYNDGAGTLTVAASGGSDPWTYLKLGSDFVTSSATAVDVTGMAFTPSANTTYEIEAVLLTRTATATVGVRPGVAWPTGMTDGVVLIDQTSAAGTRVLQNGNINAAVLAPVGGNPNNTQSYPAQIKALLVAGASPSGTFKLQLASETAATNVTIKAGSFLKYRTI